MFSFAVNVSLNHCSCVAPPSEVKMFCREPGIPISSKFIEKIHKITRNECYPSQQLGTLGRGCSEPHLDDVIILHVQLGWSLLGV